MIQFFLQNFLLCSIKNDSKFGSSKSVEDVLIKIGEQNSGSYKNGDISRQVIRQYKTNCLYFIIEHLTEICFVLN